MVANGPSDTPNAVSGTIDGWNMGDTIRIVLGEYRFTRTDGTDSMVTFGSCAIDKDGAYTFLLTAPHEDVLYPAPVGFTVNDTNVRFTFLERPMLVSHQKQVGYIYFRDKKDETPLGMNHREAYIFSTKDVEVKGLDTNYYFQATSTDIITVVTKKNIILKQGWNKVVTMLRSSVNNVYEYESYKDNAFLSKTFYKYPMYP